MLIIGCSISWYNIDGCNIIGSNNIVGGTWLVANFLFVTIVGLTLMSETLVDVRVL